MFTEARLLANLRTPTQTQEEFEKTRRRLLCELSAQIDQGRLFFENELKDRHGTDKEPAYRGFTPKIIQVLKVPYRELTKIKFNCSESQPHPESGPIWKAQRDFVSILQEEVGPSWITKARAYDEPLTSENLQRSTDLLFRQAGPDLDAKRLRSLWTRFQGGSARALTWRLRSDGR
jgi:hypothetical protein